MQPALAPRDWSRGGGIPAGRAECAPLEDLVARAQVGDTSAFEALVRELGPRLHRYLAVRLRSEADARDALQETLFAAWAQLPKLRRRDRVWPWLVGIAAHKAADVLRARPPLPTDATDERSTLADTGLVELRDAIDELPAHLREVILLRYLLELSELEAAEVLGVRPGTIKSRAARARERLAWLWEPAGELEGR